MKTKSLSIATGFAAMLLAPAFALNIGCTDHRLIVLAATTDSTYLASYVLPVRLRDSTFAHEATVIAPPSPISRRAN